MDIEAESKAALYISLASATGIFIIGLIFATSLLSKPHQRLHYPVLATPYISAPGCKVVDYSPLSKINKFCLRGNDHIKNSYDYGLFVEYKGNLWYRINNDAVYVNCSIFDDWCMSHYIVQGFFRQAITSPM